MISESESEKERERESIRLRTLFDQDKIDSTLLLEGRANIGKTIETSRALQSSEGKRETDRYNLEQIKYQPRSMCGRQSTI